MTTLRVLLIAINLVILSNVLQAQLADVQISRRDNGYRSAQNALVQDADSSGANTMVAWGSTAYNSAGGLVTVIYVQLFEGGVPYGAPTKLPSFESPNFVQLRVVAVGGDFLILTNGLVHSYTTSTHTFNQPALVLELNGLATDDDHDDIMAMGSAQAGWRLYWYRINETLPAEEQGLYTCRFDSMGTVLEEGRRVAARASWIIPYSAFPDFIFIANSEGPSYIANKVTGAVDSLSIPPINGAFHLGRDRSLVFTRGDSIYRFSTLYSPDHIARPIPPMAGLGARMITRDDAGNIEVYSIESGNGGLDTPDPAWYRVRRIRLDAALNVVGIDTLLQDTVEFGDATEYYVALGARIIGCDNRAITEILYVSPYHRPVGYRYHMLTGPGALATSLTRPDLGCYVHSRPIPLRIASDTASIVAVPMRDTVVLSVPFAHRRPDFHTYPGIVAFPSAIVCTWRDSSEQPGDRLATWQPTSDEISPTVRYAYAPPGYSIPSGALTSREEVNVDSLFRSPGNVAIEHDHVFRAYITGSYGSRPPIEYHSPIANSHTVFMAASAQGWKEIESIALLGNHGTPPFSQSATSGRILGSDPETGDIAALITSYYFDQPGKPQMRIYHRDTAASPFAAPAVATVNSTAFPLRDHRLLVVARDTLFHTDGSSVLGAFALPTIGYVDARPFKLTGPSIARVSWTDSTGRALRVETYDTAGVRRVSATLERPERTNDYTLIGSAADGLIAIVFGGEHGLRAALLTSDLKIIAADTLLSVATGRVAHPAVAFRHDTLFAVWEEYATQYPTINGLHRALHTDPTLAVEQCDRGSAVTTLATVHLYPNPATGSITIEADLAGSNGMTLEIFTALGEVVLQRALFDGASGPVAATLDISGLPAGVYIARMRNGEEVMVRRFIKK
jgi:hypothetical protein